MRRLVAFLLLAFWIAQATAQTPPKPGPKDTCPVCGMLVAKYPNWAATVVYKDGHAHHFDGPKDMFKYWFDPGKYAKNHERADIVAVWVTDYYNLQPMDAHRAYFVVGSDALGPMGHEFVPLANSADATEFSREHKGVRILRFDDVTPELAGRVDDGKF
jgi:nitrous oxide reductase accessory protein NosL